MRLSQTVHKTKKMNEGDKPKAKKATKRNTEKIEVFIEEHRKNRSIYRTIAW